MRSRIAGRTGTFGKWVVPTLFIAALVFALAISRQAQTGTAKPKPTQTQRATQQSIKLERIVFQKDKAVSYRFKSGTKTRIVTYRTGKGNSVVMDVRETPRGKPFVELLATNTGIRARTPQGRYKLVKGKRVLPASTDSLSLLLLANNLVKNPTLSPQAVYNTAFAQLVAANKAKGQKGTLRKASGGVPVFSAIAAFNLWDWVLGGGDCNSRSTTCTEIDSTGQEKTITFTCDCGKPHCDPLKYGVVLPVLEVNLSEDISSRDTLVWCTRCVCICLPVTSP